MTDMDDRDTSGENPEENGIPETDHDFEAMLEEDAPDMPQSLNPDAILDTILPDSIDWKGTVQRFPLISVAGIALVGYLVGRKKGGVIVSGLTAALSSAMMHQLSDVFEGDFFDY